MTSLEAIVGIKLFCPTSAQGSSQKGMRMVRSLHEASHWHGDRRLSLHVNMEPSS